MTATVIHLSDARAARGLGEPVRPEDIFLPPIGKRAGDRVKTLWGEYGTVIMARRGEHFWRVAVQTARGVEWFAEGAVKPAGSMS